MGDVIGLRRDESLPEPLWREVWGGRVRQARRDSGRTLTETAARAGISPQYLSELERGRKDPSSEIVAAVAGALDLTVLELSARTVRHLATAYATAPAPAPTPGSGRPRTMRADRLRGPLALAA